jgi:hypothetical protein
MRSASSFLWAARLVGGLALFAVTALGTAGAVAANDLTPGAGTSMTDPRHGDDSDCDTVDGRDGPLCNHGITSQ